VGLDVDDLVPDAAFFTLNFRLANGAGTDLDQDDVLIDHIVVCDDEFPGRGACAESAPVPGQIAGDGNQDSLADLSDAIFFLSKLFLGRQGPPAGALASRRHPTSIPTTAV
jgi:hypothetical protein